MCATGSRRLFGGTLLLLVAAAAGAQDRPPSVEDIAPIDRQTPHFYGAIAAGGRGVQVAWAADPATVPADGEFTLTLAVRGAANSGELVKPDLRRLDAFTERFQFLDPPAAPPVLPGATEARFTYRLRPRAAGPTAVPELRYAYYRPDSTEGKRFRTTYADAVPITVISPAPKAAPPTPPVPLDGPEEFFTLADDARQPLSVGRFLWLLPVAAVPFLVAGWVVAWRTRFPDAVQLARLRRGRAARVALHRLKAARRSADPARDAAAALRDYLATRFAVPPPAETPGEVAAALRGAGQPDDLVAATEALLRACDAARFAAAGDDGLSLVPEAERLVGEWEGVRG